MNYDKIIDIFKRLLSAMKPIKGGNTMYNLEISQKLKFLKVPYENETILETFQELIGVMNEHIQM